jgi:S1-C subfamily serine protease
MNRNWVLLLWPLAAAAFAAAAASAADDATVVQAFHVRIPSPGSQVSLGVGLLPRGPSGIAVAAIVPDGPADRAGIAVGDILVSINGTALDGAAAEPPIARLFNALADVAPGDSVRIDALRDGERLTTDVMADPPPARSQQFGTVSSTAPNVAFGTVAIAAAPVPNTLAYAGHRAGARALLGRAMIGGLELFDLNADLGHYFGVESGVLVLSAPQDVGLLAGDVLRSIDGEPVSASARCVGVLARASGAVNVEVLRDGAVQIVQYTPPPGGPALLPLPPQTHVDAARAALPVTATP